MNDIVLIGMPGCGKSTCGVILAKVFCMDFKDTDLIIQKSEGESLQNIINTKGNDYFSSLEESVICQTTFKNSIIATGGSVVYSGKAMKHLSKGSKIVYLKISYETMLDRIGNIKTRGIVLRNGETLEMMFKNRESLYEKYADYIIDCNNIDIEETVHKVKNVLKANN